MRLNDILRRGKEGMNFVKDYMVGTPEEISKAEGAKWRDSYGEYHLLSCMVETSLGMFGMPILMFDKNAAPVAVGVSAYMLVDGLWRSRPRRDEKLASSGIMGSVIGLLRTCYQPSSRECQE